MIGSKLAHYHIDGKLGSGGMGDVYAARDTKLDRKVALKVLPPEVAHDHERRQRLEREARTAAAINHANIVTLYSVEEADGECFITMELVEGRPLAELIPAQGLDVSKLLDIARALADAVATAHEAGIIHRDLKPANVMISAHGVVKVLDFGLAKIAPDDEPTPSEDMATETAVAVTTAEGSILGTPAYMSPEQAEGKKLDARSDIFSLGVVLYEIATGERPFAGDSAISVISSILKDDPPTVEELRPMLPARLSRMIARCLVKDRKRRYQSARDLAIDLEDLAKEASEVSEAARMGDASSAPRATVRLARAGIVVGALVLAASFGALGYRSVVHPAPPAPTAAPSVASQAAADWPRVKRFRRLTTAYGVELDPQISPDGKWFVHAAREAGKLDVFRHRVDGQKRNNLTRDGKHDDWQPAISPDGEYIAFRSERDGGGIFVMGATGESIRRVATRATTPHGRRMASSCW